MLAKRKTGAMTMNTRELTSRTFFPPAWRTSCFCLLQSEAGFFLFIPVFSLLILLTTGRVWAAEDDIKKSLTLPVAVAQALEKNPGLAEIQARYQAKSATPSQLGTLPDPVLSFNAMNLPTDTFNTTQDPMTQMQLGISQALPFPGKLSLREETAEFEADAFFNDIDEAQLQLIKQVKTCWWNLFYLGKSLQIVSVNQNLMRYLAEIAQTKYSVGDGLQQDVLLAQLELTKLLDQEIDIKNAQRNEFIRLNLLMGLSPEKHWNLSNDSLKTLPVVLPLADLFQIAEILRPILAQKKNYINAANSRLELSKKGYYPDFNIGAFYGFRGTDDSLPNSHPRSDLLTLKLAMNVPIFAYRKQAREIDQRKSEVLKNTYSLQDLRAKVLAEISTAHSDYLRTREKMVLFKSGIIPQARQTVESMIAGYQVNKVDFLNLINSQITVLNYDMRYWQAVSEANHALARLVAAVGEDKIFE